MSFWNLTGVWGFFVAFSSIARGAIRADGEGSGVYRVARPVDIDYGVVVPRDIHLSFRNR